MSWEPQGPNVGLDSIPDSWEGFSREEKVQKLLEVVELKMKEVRRGTFDASQGERIAALVLEAQMSLAGFFTDAEASARNAKHISDLAEAEAGNSIVASAEKKPSDATIKRMATADSQVQQAKKTAVELDREYKKWRCVYDILKEAHILFRNISRLA